MDLVVIIVLLVIVVLIFQRVDNLVYFIALIDIFLRIVAFVNSYIPVKEINNFLDQLPKSMPAIINKYTGGIISDILMWALVICYGWFFNYSLRNILRRK